MEKIRLGKTELMVSRSSFGALPIQRISRADAVSLVRNAYYGGINYFDTANAYTDSEEKLGEAFEGIRHDVIISTKSHGSDYATIAKNIELSLKRLRTDYIDLFQFHMPSSIPDPNDPNGSYAAALDAKKKGYIRHIGITAHRIMLAHEEVASGLFETMMFPFSYLAAQTDIDLVKECEQQDMGFIAMKGMSGGLLRSPKAAYAFIRQYKNVVPIWGIQHQWELEQWLDITERDLEYGDELKKIVEKERAELMGEFCRGCGYCLPCPVGIEINNSARMNMLLRRSPYQPYMSDEWYEKMHRIDNCLHCNQCKSRCPYELDTPALLQKMLIDYDQFYSEHKNDKN